MVAGDDSLHYPVLQSPEVHQQEVGRVLDVGRVEPGMEDIEESSRTENCLRRKVYQSLHAKYIASQKDIEHI